MHEVINLFAGPGGWDKGAEILGLTGVLGVDIDAEACATARAAGYARHHGDMRDFAPAASTTGIIASPPCPTWSAAGKRSGRSDLGVVLEAINQIGITVGGDAWKSAYGRIEDPRTALIVDAVRLATELPTVEWVLAEQVPAADPVWQELAAELATDGFATCHVATINAADLGVPSRRLRTFLVATRHDYISLDGLPTRQRWNCGRWDPPALCPSTSAPWPQRSMAAALGWSAGERINTRGNRRTSGGNEFSADGLSWCLTEKARSWKRVSDGQRLTEAQAGLLAGFPGDFPWQGSRTKAFLQAADVVAPPVAAALLGTVLGIEWGDHVAEYMERIYQAPAPPSPLPPRRAVQEELFALAS